MQRILLLVLLFAQAASCNATLETRLEALLEDASFLLHSLSRQHLLWQCNATRAPSNAHRLVSCQQTLQDEREKADLFNLTTAESLAGLLSQLAMPNDDVLGTTRQRRSTPQNQVSIVTWGNEIIHLKFCFIVQQKHAQAQRKLNEKLHRGFKKLSPSPPHTFP